MKTTYLAARIALRHLTPRALAAGGAALLAAGSAQAQPFTFDGPTTPAPEAIEVPSDGAANSYFGLSVSLSGTIGLVGAYNAAVGGNGGQGAAYVYRNLDTATGTVTQNVKLTASDGAARDEFGLGVSLSGTIGLVGAKNATVGGNANAGAAYVYRNLDTATGTVTQNVKLTASDGAANDGFGDRVSLSGNIGLVGASVSMNGGQGAAYVYRNLDTATGTVTQNVKLTASDGAANDGFGDRVSLSGNIGLVGAFNATVGTNGGAAYVFRNLDTATGTVTQNVKLTASGGAANDGFGDSVSLSGTIGLVGAYNATVGTNGGQGAAYVYRNLDTATGTVTQNVKLVASDGAANDGFGQSVSLSGGTGLVGAIGAMVGGNANAGAAYVYRNLDTATGTVTQNVKLTASGGAANDGFGDRVSLDGDRFLIGADGANSYAGKGYSGTVSSVTTLDTGNTTGLINGISFVSQDHWIIGQNTSGNQVTLSKGDTANVTAAGRGVFIGQNAGSNNNTLLVQGTVLANTVTVSSAAGSSGNTLQVANDGGATTAGTVTATTGGIVLNAGGILLLNGSTSVTDRIGNSTAVTLNGGGRFATSGLSEGTAPTASGGSGGSVGMGTLTLANTSSASRATVDCGNTAAGSALVFSSLAAGGQGSFVSIIDWTGAAGADNGAAANDRLLFATDPGYTRADLANWQFSNDAGTNFVLGAQEIAYNGYFEIVPVPEPATWELLGVGGAGLLGLAVRQRRRARLA